MGVIKAAPVGNVRVVLKEDNTVVLITLVIILRVTYLLLTSELKADPMEVCCFSPLIPDPLH